jgi:hypothetical protein
LAGLEIFTPAKAVGIMAHTLTIKKAYFNMQSDPPKDFGLPIYRASIYVRRLTYEQDVASRSGLVPVQTHDSVFSKSREMTGNSRKQPLKIG